MIPPVLVPRKPKSVPKGSKIAVFAPASPAEAGEVEAGSSELHRLGFEPVLLGGTAAEGYFSASADARRETFLEALGDPSIAAVVALRGGYGTNYLLDAGLCSSLKEPKCLVGYSDLTSLQIYLWQMCAWVTFYGPMVAAGFNRSAGDARGYDRDSLLQAVRNSGGAWELSLRGQSIFAGQAEGRVLGGCLTLVQTSLGTPWELDTTDSILVLEDAGMRPYQVDRALMHLKLAGKFKGVRGVILGEFPSCEPPSEGSPSVLDVCRRLLVPLGIPILFGAAVGHSERPMLTIPLGIRAHFETTGEGRLAFLEAAVVG